ncbi:MAG: lipid II flippase MurJ, partial [Thermodesulfobacteriota bacterium]
FYALGLIPIAGARVLGPVFYSLKDTKTPLLAALLGFIANIIFCFILIGPLKHGGLALATTLASIVNFCGLLFMVRKQVGRLGTSDILSSTVKSVISTVAMAIAIVLINHNLDWSSYGSGGRVVLLLGTIGVGIAVYVISSLIVKSPEIHALKKNR